MGKKRAWATGLVEMAMVLLYQKEAQALLLYQKEAQALLLQVLLVLMWLRSREELTMG